MTRIQSFSHSLVVVFTMLLSTLLAACSSGGSSTTCVPSGCPSGRCNGNVCAPVTNPTDGGVDSGDGGRCTAPTPTPRNMDGRSAAAFAMCGQCTSQTAGNFVACDPMRSSSCSFTGNNAVGMPRCLCGQNDQCAAGQQCVATTSGSTFVCTGGSAGDGGVVNPGTGTLCGTRMCQAPSGLSIPLPGGGGGGLGESCCNVNGVPTCVANTNTNCGCGVTCQNGSECVSDLLGSVIGSGASGQVCCTTMSLLPGTGLCTEGLFPGLPGSDGGFPDLGDAGFPGLPGTDF